MLGKTAPPSPPLARAQLAVAPSVLPAPVGVAVLPSNALVVDLRPGAPAGRALAPVDIAAFARSHPVDREVVVVCADGVASSGVAERLAALGLARVAWLEGGFR